MWRLIAKSLGDKEGKTDREADIVAAIRLTIVGINVITCFFIIANAVHHW